MKRKEKERKGKERRLIKKRVREMRLNLREERVDIASPMHQGALS